MGKAHPNDLQIEPQNESAQTAFEATLSQALRSKDFQKIVATVLQDAGSILDIGCGIGDYLRQTTPNQRVVAIEPHAPYIEKAREVAPWAEFVHTDALSFLNGNKEKFDCILMIDVIEHLNQADAIEMVRLARQFAKKMIFAQIPIGKHEQSHDIWNLGGDYWQTHRSSWDETNIDLLGFSQVIIWRDWYQWEELHKSRDMSVAFWLRRPKISIVVPTYNQAEWLPKALDSIIEQTYPFWEAVVVNDGSTDNTPAVLEEYAHRETRIRVFHKENGGISSALNMGIQQATGDYFCWLSSDDLFYPQKLARQVAAYSRLSDEYALVFGAFDLIDPEDNIKELPNEKPYLDGYEFPRFLKYDYIDGCTVMIPLSLLKELGGFNLQYKHAQDTELWFRLASLGYRFYFISEKLTLRRVHPQQGFTDFAIDCRYDGYAMIHFYLTNYSFRDFFKNVDFNDKQQRALFILFLTDLLNNSDHLVNHPTLYRVFWKWLKDGLLSLHSRVRSEIILGVIGSFLKAQPTDEWKQQVKKALKQLYLEINNKPINRQIESYYRKQTITAVDRASDVAFWEEVYKWGKSQQERNNLQEAFYAFKYLADRENPYYAEAYQHLIEISYRLNYFEKFLRSFRRKQSIVNFPDHVKGFYIWCLLQTNADRQKAEEIASSISQEALRKKVRHWIDAQPAPLIDKTHIRYWNYAVDQKLKPWDVKSNRFWETVIVYQGVIHQIKVVCPECGSLQEYSFRWALDTTPSEKRLLCPQCLRDFRVTETVFQDYFLSKAFHDPADSFQQNTPRRIYFVLRYTNIVGGGVKKVLQFIEWLDYLGCQITIYSIADPPAGKKLPGVFIKVRDHSEDRFVDPDLVVVFSVYDIPKIIDKVPLERIVHLCQGYEGYHIGTDFQDMRRDKFFYTALHSIPVKNIVVSKHLLDLFRGKFQRQAEYIPNGIDLAVFSPAIVPTKLVNSILFIGNPVDRLKGFKFLVDTLTELQNSPRRIAPLNLVVVCNIDASALPTTIDNIPSLKIHWNTNLGSHQVADLIRRVNLVVVTSMYEGFSLPALEAMACGTPVITTNNLGAESFCEHDKNSLIVEFGDRKLFGQYIYEILTGRRDLIHLIQNGFRTAQVYSLLNSSNAFLSVFQKLLAQNFKETAKSRLLESGREAELEYASLTRSYLRDYSLGQPLVSIIILTYNCLEYTRKCVESILEYTDFSYELIFVDNGSGDDTIAYLEELNTTYPHIRLILNNTNRGYPAGNNQGAELAQGRYLLFLHNDVMVSRGWLSGLVGTLERHPRIGAVGPMTNYINGRQRYLNVPYQEGDEVGFHAFAEQVSTQARDKVTPHRRLSGFALLMPKNLFAELGGFDESFGTGNFEDDDLCLRIRARGFTLMVNEGVYIHHFGSQTCKANGIDSPQTIKEYLRIFQQKWPTIDYDELLEINETLVAKLEQHKQQAQQAMAQGHLLAAIDHLEIVNSANPLDAQAILWLAECYHQTNRIDQALRLLKDLLRLQPPLAEAFALAARITAEQNQHEKAAKLWQQALNLKPADPIYRQEYAEFLIAQGNLAAATEQYEKLCDLEPNNSTYLIKLGELYCRLSQIEKAQHLLQKAHLDGAGEDQLQDLRHRIELLTQSTSQPTSLEQAVQALQQGDYLQALTAFQNLLQNEPQSEDVLLGLALCYLHQDQFAAATQYLNELLRLYPENPMGYHMKGMLAYRTQDYSQAKDFFAMAYQKEPAMQASRRYYAESLYHLGELTASRRVYEELLQQNHDDQELLFRIGSIAFEEGARDVAIAMFDRLLGLDPQNTQVRQLLNSLEE